MRLKFLRDKFHKVNEVNADSAFLHEPNKEKEDDIECEIVREYEAEVGAD
jgi:hypothetical protein